MFANYKTSALIALFALAPSVVAAPDALQARQVQSPPPKVTYPHTPAKSAVWAIGSHHNVTWEPSNDDHSTGMIILAKGGIEDCANALVEKFPISSGHVVLQVPDVIPGDDYSIHLYVGDQSSSSAPFIIAHSKHDAPSSSAIPSGSTSHQSEPSSTASGTTATATPSGASTSEAPHSSSEASSSSSGASRSSSVASTSSSGASRSSSAPHSSSDANHSSSDAHSSSSAHPSSVKSSVAPTPPVRSAAPTNLPTVSPSSNAASSVKTSIDATVLKLLTAVGAVALSAGIFVL